jgi:glycosyltransferase involved in cell wall biosynthesis
MKISRLIVVDGNAPWVRSLFLAMPPEIHVRFLRVGQPLVFKQLSDKPWWTARRWQPLGPNAEQRWVIIPGWNKAPAISTWLTRRAATAAARGSNAAVIFTLPQYAGVAETTQLRPRVYYAHDPFEYYGWDREWTRQLESRMLQAVELTFSISRLLRDELALRALRGVHYSPNAVSSQFLTELRKSDSEIPPDLANIARPIVGCTGQINETYDWPMLGELAARMPDVSFIFIGPIVSDDPAHRAVIDGVLKGRANVHWLGPKPHADLPVYLRSFDVCLNPLSAGPHADRRSPLRLYDFLATGKPVISTAIAEAESHENQVWIGRDVFELESLIRSAVTGQRQVDANARRAYNVRNTWDSRALKLLAMIERCISTTAGES